MTETSRQRATRNYRQRLKERGLSRFAVVARERDQSLIRAVAKRLARDDAEASRLREVIAAAVGDRKGGIWAALRRSPLVGSNLDLSRPWEPAREIDLDL
jgi:hypothetical protein